MQEEVKHYKVKSLGTTLRPNSVYYVKPNSQTAVLTYITDQTGVPYPLIDLTGVGNIQTVTGTGVTGTASNPIVDISTFNSSQLGNLIQLSSTDGKLFVKPITSPDGSISIVSTLSELQIEVSEALQAQIQSALQPGDNISELTNDAGYITSADVPTNTSDLVNDGEDGINPFITAQDIQTYTANNGLSAEILDPNNFQLGGTLTKNTTIDLAGTYNLQVSGAFPLTPLARSFALFSDVPGHFSIGDVDDNLGNTAVVGVGKTYRVLAGTNTGIDFNFSQFNYKLGQISNNGDWNYIQVNGLLGGSFSHWGADVSLNLRRNFNINAQTGGLTLDNYGDGTFLNATPAYSLGVDASGNVVEFTAEEVTPSFQDTITVNKTADEVELLYTFFTGKAFTPALDPPGFLLYTTYIKLAQNGGYYVYGNFNGYDGGASKGIVKILPSGQIDTSFSTGTGFNNFPYTGASLLEDDDNNLYVSGNFTTYNNTSSNKIVKLKENGSIDTSFVVGAGFTNNGACYTNQMDFNAAKTAIYVTGLFNNYKGTPAGRIAKILLNGNLDTSFATGAGFAGGGNSTISIVVNSNDTLFITTYATLYKGAAIPNIIKILPNGNRDFSFESGSVGFSPGGNIPVYISKTPDNKIIAVGSFTSYNGTLANGIIKINQNGTVDNSFVVGTGFVGTPAPGEDLVSSIQLVDNNTKYLCNGSFTSFKGVATNGTVVLDLVGNIIVTYTNNYSTSLFINNALLTLAKTGTNTDKLVFIKDNIEYLTLNQSLTFDKTNGKAEYNLSPNLVYDDLGENELVPKKFITQSISKTTSFTAVNSGIYNTNGTLTVTDPAPDTNKGYIVHVVGGTTKIGGVDYTTGSLVYRFFNGTSWISKDYGSTITPVIDANPTDGSSNAVSSNGVFDALASKEPSITAGTTSQYWRGDKTWQTLPTIPTVGTWGGLNYPTWTTGTPFVKMTATGTFALDTNTYLTSAVTSVGLSMPSAFTVTNSPVTSTGTLTVTGAGAVSQYIRGDGTLANFPASTGGGASLSFYLNGSVSQGTFGGIAFKEMDKTPILGAGTDFTINANGYIQSFITDANVPNQLEIPAGNWNFETYFSANNGGGSPSFYVELYKWNGATLSLIASSSANPEGITNGTVTDLYVSALAVPQTALLATDRLAVRIYVSNSGRTIKLHTENGHLCQVITTFSTGLTALNGLTAQVQNFAVGTAGTDFAISSATATHTFNLPTASAINRGALSSADWTIFNNKQDRVSGVSDTEIGYLDGVTSAIQSQIDNLIELNFLRQNVGYIIPAGVVNIQPSFSVSPNLAGWGLSLSGNTATGGTGGFVRFITTATAGTVAFRKGSFGIVLGNYQFEYTQKVRFQTNLTGQRGLWGLSGGYTYATPTNVEPNTNVNVVGVCQLSTSTNLHILHNDASGLATTFDLGVDYPCNTSIYTYYTRIKRTTSNYTITVERITNTDNSSISNVYTTSTNIPSIGVNDFSPTNYITNNAQAIIASYFDGGCIAKLTHQ